MALCAPAGAPVPDGRGTALFAMLYRLPRPSRTVPNLPPGGARDRGVRALSSMWAWPNSTFPALRDPWNSDHLSFTIQLARRASPR